MISEKLKAFGVSVFTEISALAATQQAVNLSQGFPNFEGPKEIKEIFAQEILNGWNQYVPSSGLSILKESISHYLFRYYNFHVNPETEITITCGATEALHSSINGLFNPDDEIIVLEPFYDAYLPDIAMAGAKAVPLKLDLDLGQIDMKILEAAINPNTKGIIVNNPHNPSGMILPEANCIELLKLVEKYHLILISDEVYEQLYYDDAVFKPLISYGIAKDRVVSISSVGKSFSFTGWKIGWAIADKNLSQGIRAAHQFTSFCNLPAGQVATAAALNLDPSYFKDLRRFYNQKRLLLMNGLHELGFNVLRPKGSYFLLADYSNISNKNDRDFCLELIEHAKVATIPPRSFYSNDITNKYLRFCFAKSDDILEKALENLWNYLKK